MLRKLFIVTVASAFGHGTMAQAYVTSFVVFFWVSVQARVRPYRFWEDDLLKYLCDVCIFAATTFTLVAENTAGAWPRRVHGVALGVVPLAYFCGVFIKIVRIKDTRTHESKGVWRELARMLRINGDRNCDNRSEAHFQRPEVNALRMYFNGIISDTETKLLLDYFNNGQVQHVFVSSPEESGQQNLMPRDSPIEQPNDGKFAALCFAPRP